MISGFGWSSSRDTLIVLVADSTGASSLLKLDLVSGRTASGARGIDASALVSPIAVAADGRLAYVAAAGTIPADNAIRHVPAAHRRMSIYEFDVSNNKRRVVAEVDGAADLLNPQVANGRLYWTRAESHTSIVTLPMRAARRGPWCATPRCRPGGPTASSSGSTLATGELVDWAINWDAGAISVDGQGLATGRPVPLITNYAEDFEPEWSPNGRWIAYHSHRAAMPIAYYGAPGSTDDIWLRRAGRPPRDSADIRLTDFGFEAGAPSWSRHGDQLVFGSYDRQGVPGINLLWLVTIDTVTGRPLNHARVPLPAGVTSVSWAAWSPVADEIAIEADAAPGTHALWIMSPSGTSARKVVGFPSQTFSGVDWTPDGKTLVYAALAAGQHAALRDSRGGWRRATADARRREPDASTRLAQRPRHRGHTHGASQDSDEHTAERIEVAEPPNARRQVPNSAKCRRAPGAERRQVPNSARCRTAPGAEQRQVPNSVRCRTASGAEMR